MDVSHTYCSTCMPLLTVGAYPPTRAYDVDIIILTQNRYQDTLDAVDSALRQRDTVFHISVLDQGSDASIQIKFSNAFRGRQNLGYYVNERNIGVGGGRNFLTSIGSGRFIIALDNDATFACDSVVARAIKAFEEMPSLGILGFKIFSRDGIHLDEFSWGYPSGLKKYSNGEFVTTTFVGAGHAIRRTTWSAVGGYDADLFFTWEEYDLSLRAIALGWLIKCDGSLAIIHKVSSEQRVQWSSERMRLYVRNRLILARKWHLSWMILAPRIIIYLIKAARNNGFLPALWGLLAAIGQDRLLLKHPINLHARHYVNRNETRFHDNPFQFFYNRILVRMRPDP